MIAGRIEGNELWFWDSRQGKTESFKPMSSCKVLKTKSFRRVWGCASHTTLFMNAKRGKLGIGRGREVVNCKTV